MQNLKLLVGILIFCSGLNYGQNNVLNAEPVITDEATPTEILQTNIMEPIRSSDIPDASKVMWCPSANTLNTGYPAWTHSWAGWMVNIKNISTNTITINCFEARFQGTSGYRIYTKTGTFVGFEATAGAWTLVGTAANVTGVSTTTSSPIPIAVNVNINPGATQAFYLTRTDNLSTTRHLYIAGSGTAGTTVYANDANIQLIEGNYVDVYFILMGGPRRPSMKVYYSILNPLPIELSDFKCRSEKTGINLSWNTTSEKNNAFFKIERSSDGVNFNEVGRVIGAGNSNELKAYSYTDQYPSRGVNYYRLTQVDFNDMEKLFDPIVCDFQPGMVKVKVYTATGVYLTGFECDDYNKSMRELGLLPGVYLLEMQIDENPYFIKYLKQE